MTQTKGHTRVNWHAPKDLHAKLRAWCIQNGKTLQDGLTQVVERVVAPAVQAPQAAPFWHYEEKERERQRAAAEAQRQEEELARRSREKQEAKKRSYALADQRYQILIDEGKDAAEVAEEVRAYAKRCNIEGWEPPSDVDDASPDQTSPELST